MRLAAVYLGAMVSLCEGLVSAASFMYKLLYTTTCLLLSLIFPTIIFGHKLSIGHISFLSVGYVSLTLPDSCYTISPATEIRFTSFSLHPRFPEFRTPPPPETDDQFSTPPSTFLTLELRSALLTSPLSTVSTTHTTVHILLYPTAWPYRTTGWPLVHTTLRGFKLRVLSSTHTPHNVQRMREALVGTIIFGEVSRFAEFRTKVQFGPDFIGHGQDMAGPGIEKMGMYGGDANGDAHGDTNGYAQEQDSDSDNDSNDGCDAGPLARDACDAEPDDLFVTAYAASMHMDDLKGRVYAFDEVTACLRRTWGAYPHDSANAVGKPSRGEYEMTAAGARWVRMPTFGLCDEPSTPGRFRTLLARTKFMLLTLPYTLVTDPMLLVDLYVPDAHIRFDDFRIRDAELVRQGFEVAARTYAIMHA